MEEDLRRRELRAQELMAEKQRLIWEEEKRKQQQKIADEKRKRD